MFREREREARLKSEHGSLLLCTTALMELIGPLKRATAPRLNPTDGIFFHCGGPHFNVSHERTLEVVNLRTLEEAKDKNICSGMAV